MAAPFEHLVTSVDELRDELYPEPPAKAWAKEIDHLDEHCRDFLARSPIAFLGTSDAQGGCDVTPRGGPPGFARVLGPDRLAFADLTGNRRLDAFRNVLENPQVGLVFLIPGLKETLRVNGRAHLTRDPAVLRACDVPSRTADLAFGVVVETAFLHCAKALIRSQLWEPETWPSNEELPSPAMILRDHVGSTATLADVELELSEAYSKRLW